ncbi:hypothetical protein [Actinomadura rupiterrae]|uniref:hypothetical protein n=1 Tax=Actinomadura rupiterrae TaxID=559627 RepID=UPI0020A29B17|nr:hypothetical protein [Actinomadura rupiterrae]MCP2341629.1 hypothetical protein [Actinomadura rupiterrae]
MFSGDYSQHVTTHLLTTGYRIVVIADVFAVLVALWIAYGLQQIRWIGWGIPALIYIGAPFLGLLTLALVRVWSEYLTVIFGISGRIHDLDAKLGYLAGRAYAAEQAANASVPPDPRP